MLEDVCVGTVAARASTATATALELLKEALVSRADRVARAAGRAQLDALLVTEPANLRYVTGFTGSNGFAVVGPDVRRFVTDFRYVEQAKAEVDGLRPRAGAAGAARGAAAGLARGRLRLGFDDEHVSVRAHRRLREMLPDRRRARAARRASSRTERAVKEPGEVARIRAAAALVDEIYAWLLEFGLVGRTERAVAVALEHEMRAARRLRAVRSPRSSPPPSTARCRTRSRATSRSPRDTLVTIDIGARARRLLLGLHAHVGDGRPPGRAGGGLRARAARRR